MILNHGFAKDVKSGKRHIESETRQGLWFNTQTFSWQCRHGCVTLGVHNRNPVKDLHLTKIGACTIRKDFIVFVTILLLFYALCFVVFFFK